MHAGEKVAADDINKCSENGLKVDVTCDKSKESFYVFRLSLNIRLRYFFDHN